MKPRQSLSLATLPAIWSLLIVLGLTAGCDPRARHDKALRQRHTEFIQALYREDYDTCVEMTDPEVIRAKGTEMAKGTYKLVGAMVKHIKLTPEDVRIDHIRFDAQYTSAEVQTSHRIKGEWKSQKPSSWTNVKGQWYFKP